MKCTHWVETCHALMCIFTHWTTHETQITQNFARGLVNMNNIIYNLWNKIPPNEKMWLRICSLLGNYFVINNFLDHFPFGTFCGCILKCIFLVCLNIYSENTAKEGKILSWTVRLDVIYFVCVCVKICREDWRFSLCWRWLWSYEF